MADYYDLNGDGFADSADTDLDGAVDTYDTNGDGNLDSHDSNLDGYVDSVDSDGDGNLDTFDVNFDGVADVTDFDGDGYADGYSFPGGVGAGPGTGGPYTQSELDAGYSAYDNSLIEPSRAADDFSQIRNGDITSVL